VRVFVNGKATEYSFYVQLKATESIQRYANKKAEVFSYPIPTSHLEHWSLFWEPVLLILWDAKEQGFYWECVQKAMESSTLPQICKQKTVSIRIPTVNTLNKQGIRRIVALTKRRFGRFEREKQGAEHLLEFLQDELNLNIIYDPHLGFLLMPKGRFLPERGGFAARVFGKMAEKPNVPESESDEAIKKVGEAAIKLFERYMESRSLEGEIVLRGKDGVVHKWNTFAEYLRDFGREQELDEADS
jgi:hypothetical protein